MTPIKPSDVRGSLVGEDIEQILYRNELQVDIDYAPSMNWNKNVLNGQVAPKLM